MKKKILKQLIMICMGFILVYMCLIYWRVGEGRHRFTFFQKSKSNSNRRTSIYPDDTNPETKRLIYAYPNGTKIILVWNRPVDWGYQTTEKICEYKNCAFIDNKSELPRSDAVLFHAPNLQSDLTLKKVLGQIFVFWTFEPPERMFTKYNDTKWQNFFNWTMSYRRDADVFQPYVRFVPRDKHKPDVLLSNLSTVVDSKSKEIAWFVSHCTTESKREKYVTELQNYMNIDIYGKCGPLKCADMTNRWNCLKLLNDYKYYLGFENTVCRDYVTEKQLFTCYNRDNLVIPVTRGAPQSYLYKPPNSFIDTSNFSSVKELAGFLKQVAGNKTRYMEYFHFRKYFDVEEHWYESVCELCRKLNHADKYKGLYENIDKWTNEAGGQPVCDKNPTDFKQ